MDDPPHPTHAGRFKRNLHLFWLLLKRAAVEWWNDNTFRMAAALAFYTIFSLAPVLVIAAWIGGLLLDTQSYSVRQDLAEELETLIGAQGGQVISQVLESATLEAKSPTALLIGVIAVLVVATFVFVELQAALNDIWGVQAHPKRSMVKAFINARLRSFGIAIVVGFLLLVSLVFSMVLQLFENRLANWLPSVGWLWRGLHLGAWLVLVAVLFALIYRYLPDVRLRWKDVAVGSLVTALLFGLGKYFIGVYLGHTAFGSSYGAAGSFVVFLIWVYYSALICLFGAEFTQVYAQRLDPDVEPEEFADWEGEDVGKRPGKKHG